MKRKITLSIALVMSIVLVSLMSSDSRVGAQNQIRVVGDSGVVSLGEGQKLRVTVLGYGSFGELPRVRFTQIKYAQGTCSGGVCKLAAVSQTASDVIPLQSGEGAFFDIFINDEDLVGVRGVVLSNRRNVQVTATIINASGEVVSHIIIANTEGDIF